MSQPEPKDTEPEPTRLQAFMRTRAFCLFAVVAQTVAVLYFMRKSRTQPGARFVASTSVVMVEVAKLAVALPAMALFEGGPRALATLARHCADVRLVARTAGPALLYAVQNNLLVEAMSNLPISVYHLTYQGKILSTALMMVLVLGRPLGGHQWFALLSLTAGVATIQLDGAPVATQDGGHEQNRVWGMIAIAAACLTSALAGALMEQMMKDSRLQMWTRNSMLALVSVPLGLVLAARDWDAIAGEGGSAFDFAAHFLDNYSTTAWTSVWLNAAGGLIIAYVLKYADNITKCFGNAIAITVLVPMSAWVEGNTLSAQFVAGSSLVLFSCLLYSLGWDTLLMRGAASPSASSTPAYKQLHKAV